MQSLLIGGVLILACYGVQALKVSPAGWGITIYTKITSKSLRAVSAVSSSFIWEGTMQFAWQDDLLGNSYNNYAKYYMKVALDASQSGNTKYPVTANGEYTYWPNITPVVKGQLASQIGSPAWEIHYGIPKWIGNDVGPFLPTDDSVWVQAQYDVIYTIACVQDLRNFPLDTQTLTFAFDNTAALSTDMKFEFVSGTKALITPPKDPDGYTLTNTAVAVITEYDPNYHGIRIDFTVKRVPDFYFNRFVLPLTLVSTMILLLLTANTGTRVMAAFTIIGTTTSFVFISSNSVPLLPYRTRLDNYFTFQFVFAFCVGMWNLYSSHRVDRFRDRYIKSFTPREEKKEKEEEKKDDSGKPDPTKLYVVPKSTAGWVMAVLGVPGALKPIEDNRKVSAISAVAIQDDKMEAGIGTASFLGVSISTSAEDKKKDKGEDRPKAETLESLMQKLLDFHLDQKKDDKKKAKDKKADETKMLELHFIYDVRTSLLISAVYILCVACIFLA